MKAPLALRKLALVLGRRFDGLLNRAYEGEFFPAVLAVSMVFGLASLVGWPLAIWLGWPDTVFKVVDV